MIQNTEMDMCGTCMGSGYGGHPDSGANCYACGGSGGVLVPREVMELRAELSAVSAAIGSVRWMDPPDGGSVTLSEQVGRMRVDLETAERERDEAWSARNENAKLRGQRDAALAANAALMTERTSLIDTKREQLDALTAERDMWRAQALAVQP